MDDAERMVSRQIRARGVRDEDVLTAMRSVPRHLFVPANLRHRAYEDQPLPIGLGQTISQPFIVALMTEALAVGPEHRVLEIGTGCGYQTAVLAELAESVYSVEILEILHRRAARALESLGYHNVHLRQGDGYEGWADAAPFDRIIVTAAVDHVPPSLVEQAAEDARMVLPVGPSAQMQHLVVAVCSGGEWSHRRLDPVRFVPMTGKARSRQ